MVSGGWWGRGLLTGMEPTSWKRPREERGLRAPGIYSKGLLLGHPLPHQPTRSCLVAPSVGEVPTLPQNHRHCGEEGW